MSEKKAVYVSGKTVYNTHIFDGEEVVRGGEDGQVYIATFADSFQAERFVSECNRSAFMIRGYVSGSGAS